MTPETVAEELWNIDPAGEVARALCGVRSIDKAGQPLVTEFAGEFAARGLYVQPRNPREDQAIRRAGALIHCVPSLERVVLGCVRELLCLVAPDEWHDVSHSEPRWPNLIFVSLPPSTLVGDVRLAEAIVHEAMHLNLSFVENRTQLIANNRELYSPWRLESRPAGGVLHGVYVFASLLCFFEHLQRNGGLSPEQREHLARRCADILQECLQVERNKLWHSLTDYGQTIAERIFQTVDNWVG